MYHHVTSDLVPIQAVIPDFEQAHDLESNYMEHKYIQRILAYIHQQATKPYSQATGMYKRRYTIGDDKAYQSRQRKRQYIAHGAAIIHPAQMQDSSQTHQSKEREGQPPSPRHIAAVATHQIAGAEEKQAPNLAHSAVGNSLYPRIEEYAESSESECNDTYQHHRRIAAQPRAAVQQFI